MSTTTENMIDAIVKIAEDYEGTNFTNEHVEKWLNQFLPEQHDLILKELHSILSKVYVSKEGVIKFFEALIENENIFPMHIKNYKFINPQKIGGSQKVMLEIVGDAIQKKYGISLEECGQNYVSSYIYIDDAIYSGNRVVRDIQNWADTINDPNSIVRIDIIVIAFHNRNFKYIKEQIEKVLPKAEIKFWRRIEFLDSLRGSRQQFESYWPSAELEYNNQTDEYIASVTESRSAKQNEIIPLLRNSGEPILDEYFTNSQNRKLVEKIFFEKGVEIVNYAVKPNPNMRPMGYDFSKTLGFGSYFVTYRNIANNCPLVLWWGDLNAVGIDNWYPLFPRITN